MERIEELLTSYQENQCIVQIGATSVKAGSMQALLHGAEVAEEVVNVYSKIIQSQHSNRHIRIMNTTFFERLFNPTGSIKSQAKEAVDLKRVSRDTREIDIYEYQQVFIPVKVTSHWALIHVDMNARSIKYIDSDGEGGGQYLYAVRRWLMAEWKRFRKEKISRWKLIPSISCLVPQQTNHYDCGIFMLMFMELLANGKDISKFEDKAVLHARQYLVYQILHDKLGTSNIRLPSLALMLDRQVGGSKRITVKDTRMKKSTRLTDNTCKRYGISRD